MSQLVVPKRPRAAATDADRKRHVELILRQIESLPTLPVVATRLLSLTASDESSASQVVELINSDQALTARVLAMCHRADVPVRRQVLTVERAVVLLGFQAIRNAVLSIKVVDLFDHRRASERPLDMTGLWRHSLAVAIAAELIAAAHREAADLKPHDAFVCGLLHDVGKLALNYVVPACYRQVINLTDLNRGDIAEFERRIIGIDHHTAGKRIAEHWKLPFGLQDCIWLHGSTIDSLPKLEHRRLIGLVALADLIVRRQHIGYSGNFSTRDDPAKLATSLGLDPARVESITGQLHEQLQERSDLLGLDETPATDLLLQSIKQANETLGRLNGVLERRGQTAARQSQVLEAIARFHADAAADRGVQDVIDHVVSSAASVIGADFYAVLHQHPSNGGADPADNAWLVCQYGHDGVALRRQYVQPPHQSPDLSQIEVVQPLAVDLNAIQPWITGHLVTSQDVGQIRFLPLSCGRGTAALLLHDRRVRTPGNELQALIATWAAAIASAGQHDATRELGEELAEANHALAQTHDRLLQRESMARLGEMAAGAAHEMNNPLAVIGGRAQLLSQTLQPGSKEHHAADIILEQTNRLSDLITSLHLFAEPPQPAPRVADVAAMLDELIKRVRSETAESGRPGWDTPVSLQFKSDQRRAWIDPVQIGAAVRELLLNAVQASQRTAVHVSAWIDVDAGRLTIQVADDGQGMDEHVLGHATDPFFSAMAAGRRVGMGLTRARRLVEVHGGVLELQSKPGQGTRATIVVPLEDPDLGAGLDPSDAQAVEGRGDL